MRGMFGCVDVMWVLSGMLWGRLWCVRWCGVGLAVVCLVVFQAAGARCVWSDLVWLACLAVVLPCAYVHR